MFQPGFDPDSQNGFVEADSYVYTAMVPFDLSGLSPPTAATRRGSNSSTASPRASPPRAHPDPDGRRAVVRHPLGVRLRRRPPQTQQVVREIQDQLYTDTPGGLAGNDDLGAMSSWYVWSALGAYPETPGSADVALGSPLFPT